LTYRAVEHLVGDQAVAPLAVGPAWLPIAPSSDCMQRPSEWVAAVPVTHLGQRADVLLDPVLVTRSPCGPLGPMPRPLWRTCSARSLAHGRAREDSLRPGARVEKSWSSAARGGTAHRIEVRAGGSPRPPAERGAAPEFAGSCTRTAARASGGASNPSGATSARTARQVSGRSAFRPAVHALSGSSRSTWREALSRACTPASVCPPPSRAQNA